MVRHADPDRDGAACAAIYAPYVRDSFASFEEEPPSAIEMAQRIERISVTHPWLIIDRHGEAAGFAYASPHSDRAAYRWAADVTVYVMADHQRCGLARQLYGALLGLLHEQGIQIAYAGIALPNAASVGLHETLGFMSFAVYRKIGYKAGAWHDVGWWQQRLIPADDKPAEPHTPR